MFLTNTLHARIIERTFIQKYTPHICRYAVLRIYQNRTTILPNFEKESESSYEMPRKPEQSQAVREESRARILEAALAVFARTGYEGTSIRMIAQEARIAQGLLYNYFTSKEDVLRSIFERTMQDVQASFASAEHGHTPHEQLERLIRHSFELVAQHQNFWRLSYGVRMQTEVLEKLGPHVLTWTNHIRSTLEAHFLRIGAKDPVTEAAILFALIDGVAQHYVLEPETYPLQSVVDRIVALYTK